VVFCLKNSIYGIPRYKRSAYSCTTKKAGFG
jgi:hypothetical protein